MQLAAAARRIAEHSDEPSRRNVVRRHAARVSTARGYARSVNLAAEAARLRAGAAGVTFTTSGSSMEPRVRSGATVTVAALAAAPRKGTGADSNNRGHVNGWTAVELIGRIER